MPLDPLIASGGNPIQIDNPVNKMAALLQAQGFQLKNQESDLALQTQQRTLDESNRLRDVLSQPGFDPNNVDHQRQLIAAAPQAGPAFLNSNAQYKKTQADTREANGRGMNYEQDAVKTALANTAPYLNGVNSAEGAATWLRGVYSDPVLGPMAARMAPIDQAINEIPQDPAGLQQWKMAHANITPEKLIEMTQAKPTEITNGQLKSFRDMNPNSPTYGKDTGGAPVQMQATPGEVLTSKTSLATNAATNATSRANNAANIGKDYAVAGLNSDGTLNTGNSGSLIDMLGNYQLDPKQALARAPLGQRAALISAVQSKYPGWDETTYDAKKTAANAFTTGPQGVQLNKFATTGEHLDQLMPMIDALNNGDNQTVNKIGNTISKWNGGTAVTNFDAVKSLATKEMMAALVAGGGGEGERNELGSSLANANSPAQLKGVVAAYRGMMGAKEDNLIEQRRAAGLPDATLPKYHRSGDASASANSIQTPDGQVHTFPNAAAAAAFKKAAGL